MNGAESLVHSLLASGITTCFSNPGTSEMHFVAALDRIPGMRCVLGMQENVVTGMADGYWRMTGNPACTLLHCGPGLANGLANLHNARRARSGIVNIVGDMATYHRPLDAQLTADTEGFARGVSGWVRTATDAAQVGAEAAIAAQAARTHPGQIATLILPADTAWNEGGVPAARLPDPVAPQADPHAIRNAAQVLRTKSNVLILLGGRALRADAQALAHRIAAATGARMLGEMSNARVERGRGRPQLERVPYPADLAIAALADVQQIILVNAKAPVGFFAYPGKPSLHYPPGAGVHVLTRYEHDPIAALTALADELGAPQAAIPDPGPRPEAARGLPTPEGLARCVAATMPDDCIIADESVSFGRGFFKETHTAPAHDWLQITGGAIGCGMPLATGAAIGGGGRRVLNLQADGSAMYTLQSLWTQAREKLPVTTVILANRKYQILLGEYQSVGANPGRTAMDMLDIGNPDLDWVKLAGGMGVEAAKAHSLEECAALMSQSFAQPGPFVVELVI
ncbi:acetolactate synthase large subunit [Humitalea sp. 24SJ18S-53]|uniref:acetolactate synthase large subunit n=1 Tax=Humitalea sp. 24SJ18S-53 TaxID=3422307 RepID=UPI003D66DA4E